MKNDNLFVYRVTYKIPGSISNQNKRFVCREYNKSKLEKIAKQIALNSSKKYINVENKSNIEIINIDKLYKIHDKQLKIC